MLKLAFCLNKEKIRWKIIKFNDELVEIYWNPLILNQNRTTDSL